MVSGGRDSDVGIGGLVLGGGYSWFTSKLGKQNNFRSRSSLDMVM